MISLHNLVLFGSSFVINFLFLFISQVTEQKFIRYSNRDYLISGKEIDDEEDKKSDSPKNTRDNDKLIAEEPKPNCENSNERILTVQEMIFQRYGFIAMTNANISD